MENKETRKVNDVLHKAKTKIVDRAEELKKSGYKPIIVYGELEKVRRPRIKGNTRCRKTTGKYTSLRKETC